MLDIEAGEVVARRPAAAAAEAAFTVMPGIVDHHVHLGLIEHEQLARGLVVEVHDLGWAPREAIALRADPPPGVLVRVAGPFHTAPGGYPKGRSWAPDESVREVMNPEDARVAVAEAAAAKYDFLKIALNADMANLADVVLESLVSAAQAVGLPVAVHAEGADQAARAINHGVDCLVHAPWTERVSDGLLDRAAGMKWISTLAIHDAAGRATALDNIRRFRDLGGRLRYGTDMGNGPTPVGVNAEEVLLLGDAGLAGDELIAALVGDVVLPTSAQGLLFSPHPLPVSAREVLLWLADARPLTDLDPKETHRER